MTTEYGAQIVISENAFADWGLLQERAMASLRQSFEAKQCDMSTLQIDEPLHVGLYYTEEEHLVIPSHWEINATAMGPKGK